MTARDHSGQPPLMRLGAAISQAREARGLTTLAVAQATCIAERYVQCIETGEFECLPGKTFIFGFTRTICALLDLDADEYVAVLRAELFDAAAAEPSIAGPSQRSAGRVLKWLGLGA